MSNSTIIENDTMPEGINSSDDTYIASILAADNITKNDYFIDVKCGDWHALINKVKKLEIEKKLKDDECKDLISVVNDLTTKNESLIANVIAKDKVIEGHNKSSKTQKELNATLEATIVELEGEINVLVSSLEKAKLESKIHKNNSEIGGMQNMAYEKIITNNEALIDYYKKFFKICEDLKIDNNLLKYDKNTDRHYLRSANEMLERIKTMKIDDKVLMQSFELYIGYRDEQIKNLLKIIQECIYQLNLYRK